MHHHHHGHSCSHGHHGHSHHIVPKNLDRRFMIGAVINMAFVTGELGFGVISNSLGLIADAAHNFSDVIGLLLAWGGAFLARLAPTATRTYGYSGASILAALGNAALLLVATGGIIVHAISRLLDPAPVESSVVIWVALIGIVINAATAMLFYKDKDHDINVRGAYLHMAADAAVSLGVVIAGVIILKTGWFWVDPVIGLVIAAVILWGTWGLAKESLHLSLAGVPKGIDRDGVVRYLASLPGVTEVHDLHIWAMSTTRNAMTAHIIMPEGGADDAFLARITNDMEERFRIHHPTIQVERGGDVDSCRFAPEHVI
jgi:cobalt-zinc-cadmium efflux system protein